jgi:hypothetical protein
MPIQRKLEAKGHHHYEAIQQNNAGTDDEKPSDHGHNQ